MTVRNHFLQRLEQHPPAGATVAEVIPLELDDEQASRCFGYLRGVRDRAENLELRRQREGDSISFPYTWLGPSRFHPSSGILLVFSAGDLYGVRIRGRHLNTLYDGISLYDRGLLRRRVTYICEVTKENRAGNDNECVVERIEIVPLLPENVLQFLGIEG